jgi:hypothetical protein
MRTLLNSGAQPMPQRQQRYRHRCNSRPESRAGLVVAKDLLDKNDLDSAFEVQARNNSTNALGAEAKYHMAYVRQLQAKHDAEKEVFDLVKKYAAYDH